MSNLILFVGHCDLYCMVQGFCLVFPTVSNRKASYFGYLFSLTLSMTSHSLLVTVTYISQSSDFALYLSPCHIGH